MRPDFHKVITERPRAGGRVKSPKGECRRDQRIPLDERPKRERIRRKWQHTGWQEKNLTDLFGPIWRFLQKNTGRPWNLIYSEICATLPSHAGVALSHAHDHFLDFVELHVVMHGKKPFTPTGKEIYGVHRWYVCPRSGILKKAPNGERYRSSRFTCTGVVKDATHQYHADSDGVWYELTLQKFALEPGWLVPFCVYRDVWLRPRITERVDYNDFTRTYGKMMYAVAKRQLNSREIRRLGLRK